VQRPASTFPAASIRNATGLARHVPSGGRFQRDPPTPSTPSPRHPDWLAGGALVGGSFDPCTRTTYRGGKRRLDALGSNVPVPPRARAPFKRAAHQATPEQRAEMLDLGGRGNPRMGVERVELGCRHPPYTGPDPAAPVPIASRGTGSR